MEVMVPKNTPIPTKAVDYFQTAEDYQTTLYVKVYEGENKYVKNNKYLGEFSLEGIPSQVKGHASIEETIVIDENGCITVSAKCVEKEKSHNLIVIRTQAQYSQQEMNALTNKAQNVWIYDQKSKEQGWSRTQLESFCNEMHDHVKDATKKVAKEIETLIKKGTQYLDRNPEGDSEDFDIVRTELKTAFQNIICNTNKKKKPTPCYKPESAKRKPPPRNPKWEIVTRSKRKRL